mmetsp:Transcript_6470/g.10287  ORF Transcript_6470/g.10287 Transcript_6470/m.10287 type:complete len:233 (+) Transcript_6470:66-764(+)
MKKSSILLLFAQFLRSSDADCTAAWGNIDKGFGCRTTGLTTNDLLTGECPPECQSDLIAVQSNCSSSDEIEDGTYYSDTLLYHRKSQTNFEPKWRNCSYGYTPTACDIAYGKADMTRFDADFGPQLVEDSTACLKENNEACSDACKAIIDEIKTKCTVGAAYSPNEGDSAQSLTTWKYPQSMIDMQYFPDTASGGFSENCWEYYYPTSGSTKAMVWASLSLAGAITVALLNL